MKKLLSLILLLVILLAVYWPAGSGAATPHAYTHFFLYPPESAWAQAGSKILVDGSGGMHVTFASDANSNTNRPAMYAYCPSNCGNSANWSGTAVGQLGMEGEGATLALDAQGRPRMMWYQQEYMLGPGQYFYAECNSGCTSASNWTVSAALPGDNTHLNGVDYFALDSQGRPRYVYLDNAPQFVSCEHDCTSAANWVNYPMSPDYLPIFYMHLVINENDQPRLLGTDGDWLYYAECSTTTCSQSEDWSSVDLFEKPMFEDIGLSLKLDTQGRPRASILMNDKLYYLWSDASAIQASSWYSYSLDLPYIFADSLDLALDEQDHPHIAARIEDLSASNITGALGYFHCTANCESAGATWQDSLVETTEELDENAPVPVTPPCIAGTWVWAGAAPSLGLSSSGVPAFTYYNRHMAIGPTPSSGCWMITDFTGLRVAVEGGGGPVPTPGPSPTATRPPAGNERIFLPVLVRLH